jgi:hypothetical protein
MATSTVAPAGFVRRGSRDRVQWIVLLRWQTKQDQQWHTFSKEFDDVQAMESWLDVGNRRTMIRSIHKVTTTVELVQ